MLKLPLVDFANRFVEAHQEIQARGRDARFYHAAIVFLTLARDQGAFFHAVEKARHVGVVGNHAFADVAASEPFGFGAAQDAQYVVLRAGQTVGFQELLGLLGEGIRNPLEGDENLRFQKNGRSRGTGSGTHPQNDSRYNEQCQEENFPRSQPPGFHPGRSAHTGFVAR
jgi:hypothetical protein